MKVQFGDSSQHNDYEEQFENVEYESIIKKICSQKI